MNNMNTKPMYVIFGIQKDKNASFVYGATDSHSGGYPFWSSSFRSADVYNECPDPSAFYGSDSYMFDQVTEIGVAEIKVVPVESVKVSNLKEYAQEKKRAAINKQIQELQQQLSNLD